MINIKYTEIVTLKISISDLTVNHFHSVSFNKVIEIFTITQEFIMKKSITVSALTLVSLFVVNIASAGTPRVDKKQRHQKARIVQGVKSGELTRYETHRLVKGQRQLHAMERHAKADGVVTGKERFRLNVKAQKESAKIYRNKHDNQKRAKSQ